jgi:RNA polymerase sigma-70 factor (ECF subfamily)
MSEHDAPADPAPPPDPSDASLVRRYRAGSQEAAAALYRRYASRLRRLVEENLGADLSSRLDPDDIVQSVFRRFFYHVDRGLYDAPDGEGLWGLFLVLALNRLRDQAAFHRSARRDVRLTRPARDGDRIAVLDADAALLRLVVQDALAGLPEAHRVAFEMRLAGYEVAEIARETGRSLRTVERVLQQTRASLHASLRG